MPSFDAEVSASSSSPFSASVAGGGAFTTSSHETLSFSRATRSTSALNQSRSSAFTIRSWNTRRFSCIHKPYSSFVSACTSFGSARNRPWNTLARSRKLNV